MIDTNTPIPDVNIPQTTNWLDTSWIPDINMLQPVIDFFTNTANNVFQNVSPAEWGLILLLGGLAFLFLRANFWMQMILKFAALLFIVAIFAILFGVIDL